MGWTPGHSERLVPRAFRSSNRNGNGIQIQLEVRGRVGRWNKLGRRALLNWGCKGLVSMWKGSVRFLELPQSCPHVLRCRDTSGPVPLRTIQRVSSDLASDRTEEQENGQVMLTKRFAT